MFVFFISYSLESHFDFVEVVHVDFVFLLLARQNKSKLSFCSCCVRRFGIAHASMALPSLNHNFFTIDDVDTGTGNLLDAAAKEVVDNLLTSLRSHYLDGVVATDGPDDSTHA